MRFNRLFALGRSILDNASVAHAACKGQSRLSRVALMHLSCLEIIVEMTMEIRSHDSSLGADAWPASMSSVLT